MIFPQATKEHAGKLIGKYIEARDKLKSTSGVVQALKDAHLGTTSNPNYELLPNAPASELPKLRQMLRAEITSSTGDIDHPTPSLDDIHKFKVGWSRKGKYDKSITSSQQELARNISAAYGRIEKGAAPELKKPMADYAKASKAIEKHGTGVEGILHSLLTGGGAGGWMMRQALLYPMIRAAGGGIRRSLNTTQQQGGQAIGYQGSIH